jgi:uncharacterized protein (DUF302 family)
MTDDTGIVTKKTKHSVSETADKLQKSLESKKIHIFARIDQQKAAIDAGLMMKPMILLIFGDPKAGTPLMSQYPSLAIDLPLKALIWEDAEQIVWVSYNSSEYLQKRHHLKELPFAAIPMLIDKVIE